MYSYLAMRANAQMVPTVYFTGAQTVGAGATVPVSYTGFPPPDDAACLIEVTVTNLSTTAGEYLLLAMNNFSAGNNGIVMDPGVPVTRRVSFSTVQVLNGQPWPFGPPSPDFEVKNPNAVPVTFTTAWGAIK